MLLNAVIIIYSFCAVLSKIASRYPVMSKEFALCYGTIIVILGFYAIVWQQIIKRLPLTTAFANKAITVVWGMVWGVLFFHESVTLGKIVGIVLVVLGVVLFSTEKQEDMGR